MQIVWNEASVTISYMPLFIIIIIKLSKINQQMLAQFTYSVATRLCYQHLKIEGLPSHKQTFLFFHSEHVLG
jgi:hypothetical protein